MRSVVGIIGTGLLVAVLAGCGSNNTVLPVESVKPDVLPNLAVDIQTDSPTPTTDAMGLMSPVDALAAIPGRESSALLLWRDGHEYDPGLAQRVETDGPNAHFLPQWEDSSSGVENLAFAIYSFNVQSYAGIAELTLEWDEAPDDYSNLWVGLSHWGNNSWKWKPGPASGTLALGGNGFADYAKPDTGQMLVSIVMLGSSPARFRMMGFGDQPQQGWPMFGLNPQGSRGSPYVGAQTDNVKWKYRTSGLVADPDYRQGFICHEPILGPDGTIYLGSGTDLHALNPDGTVKWYGEDCQPTSRPTIAADGTIYVGSWDNKLVALNPDGSLKWSFDTGDYVVGAPAVGADGTVYFGSLWSDAKFYALNPDGSLKWSFAPGFGAFQSSPVIGADGTIYVGCDNQYFYAFNLDGSLKWSYSMGNSGDFRSSAVIGSDGTIYVGSLNFSLLALNPDGTLSWEFDLEDQVKSSPAIAEDGTIYIASNSGTLFAVNPDGTELWSATDGAFGENSSPVVADDGTIYLGGGKILRNYLCL